MKFERTKHYFDAACGYRKGLREAWSKYNEAMAKLEKFKGSAGYDEDAKRLEDARKEAVSILQAEYAHKFDVIIEGMRDSAKNRPMTAPTAEELNLLTALKMREQITADELSAAAITLQNSPVALSILDEIAKKQDIHGFHCGVESTASILAKIDSLREAAKRIVTLEKPDSRREMIAKANIHSPEHNHDALYSFQYDRDFISANDCLAYCGGVNDMESFAEAVNN